MKMFGLILMTLSVASAELILDGPCPVVEPVKNFDMCAYSGRWHQMRKLLLVEEGDGECGNVYYSHHGDTVKLRLTHIVDGEAIYVEGIVTEEEDAHGSGKIKFTLTFENCTRVEHINIVATDYTSYSISYSCKYFERSNKHSLSMWVNSRFKDLDCHTRAEINAFLSRNFGHVASKLRIIDQSENACRITNTRPYSYPYHRY